MIYVRRTINEPFRNADSVPKLEEDLPTAITNLLQTFPFSTPSPTNWQSLNTTQKSGTIELPLRQWRQHRDTTHPSSPRWAPFHEFQQAITPILQSASVFFSVWQ